ncbi:MULTISPECIES: M15 family metallopeptidase [unclassified Acinetobacter]|uniref:M15 family metallopeptidase n=1 Tax=unclassified Acinetobacter TaxID=196816 RepID=UPI00190C414D|nr:MULTISPECIES: M15 family metallopeptidase [unclassified Acinetobacter]MBK0062402.1 M15 family metallopeptidase [Acinetobacter sp. S55]MBK0066206.1 M15 family metallopeptidase [Acinetobacter sp. S54]
MSKQVYVLSKESLSRLAGVNPKLVSVVKRAIEFTTQDFKVLEGVRTKEQCYINYGKGRTMSQCQAKGVPAGYAQPSLAKVTWLNDPLASKHVTGQAVDLVPYPVDWNDLSKFDAVAKAMFAAAKELNVKIRWGADWDNDGKYREKGEYDSPHFELA